MRWHFEYYEIIFWNIDFFVPSWLSFRWQSVCIMKLNDWMQLKHSMLKITKMSSVCVSTLSTERISKLNINLKQLFSSKETKIHTDRKTVRKLIFRIDSEPKKPFRFFRRVTFSCETSRKKSKKLSWIFLTLNSIFQPFFSLSRIYTILCDMAPVSVK